MNIDHPFESYFASKYELLDKL